MSEPITVYTPEGEELVMHSPKFVKEQVRAKKFYLSPFALAIEITDEETVAEMTAVLGLDEEE
jgi:hypothetical protein